MDVFGATWTALDVPEDASNAHDVLEDVSDVQGWRKNDRGPTYGAGMTSVVSSRASLRARIREHVGPWSAADAERLNKEGYGRLRFFVRDGFLYVSIAD